MFKLSAEAKVGLLVLVGSIILLYMTFAVGKYEFGEKKGYTIQAIFDSVAGLDEKAAVRMAGVKIGTVERVVLSDSRAKVIMRIDPGVRIEHGAQAIVKTMGLLGEKYVDIIPPDRLRTNDSGSGSVSDPPAAEQARYYQPGETIQKTASPSDVDKLVAQLSGIADDVKQVTASLRQVFGTERGTRSMEDILADLRQTTANIKDFSHALRSDGTELVMRLNELTASLNSVVSENRDNLKVTMENIREASKNAEMALASIEDASRKIDRGEGTLGKLVTDESMYNSIDSAAKGISDYTSRVERLKTTIGFRSEYMFPQVKDYFTLELKPRTDQYYILELVSDPFGKFSQTQTTSTPPGTTVVTNTYEYKLKYTIEFAKRFGNLAFRMGLIESTGGAAVDYFALDDRIKFSFDVWNTDSKEPNNTRAHMKATATYDLNKFFFIDAGYDNFLNPKLAFPFVGIGLRFSDEDLKYYLGSVPMPK
ncbi:MAG TPA: MlaD family protein [Nitrospirota bacterium]|nr:MlaD family protein [Nitrospirota bacterium]